MKTPLSVLGLFIGAVVNILFNLTAAALQQRAFNDQFSAASLRWLIGAAVVGLIVGFLIDAWLKRSSSTQAPGIGRTRPRFRPTPPQGNAGSGETYNVNAETIGAVGPNATVTQNFSKEKDK